MDALAYNQKLVAYESTSSLSNKDISDYLEDVLRSFDFATERVTYRDENGVEKVNVLGKRGEGVGGMAHFSHSDVVPANDWLFEDHGPFTPTIKDGRLYGRGSCDMKGSIACILAAIEQTASETYQHPLYITCTADEEVGYGGVRKVVERSELYREMVEGDTKGIIGEPTMLEVVYAHKGTVGFRAISRGKSAHSSTREGLNANLAMIPFLADMKRIYDETENDPQWHNTEFDPPTVSWNIGINDHTHAVNIKAPQSICTVYYRPMPGQDPNMLLERARQAADLHGLEFTVPAENGPLYTDPNSPFIQEMLHVVGRSIPRTVCYGTDGTAMTTMKHLVVLGPGDIAQAHTHDEWISLEQLERGTELYAKLIRHWCC
ncbi:MAG: M20 family metallopeptidase [Gemmataceae bacterium]